MPSTGIGSRGFLLQLGHSSLLQWHCKLKSGSVYSPFKWEGGAPLAFSGSSEPY